MQPDYYQKLINSLNIERGEHQQPTHASTWVNPDFFGPENSIISLLQIMATVQDSLADVLTGAAAQHWRQMLESFHGLIATTTELGRLDRSILLNSVEILKNAADEQGVSQ
ncbi:hypothetical protein OAK91_06265 [Planctomycetaceae bacterium]|nr:hypothetical protein [Planctomycetaceae bacterium]